MDDYRWSLGTLVGFPLSVLGCIAIAIALALCIRWFVTSPRGGYNDDRFMAGLFGGLALLGLIAAVGGTAWGMWPYSSEYHQWRETAGTVTAIDSRIVAGSDGNGPTERFVVTFDDGRQRSCDDTRCAQVEEGDVLTLDCKRHWQWSGSHGYDCNYVSHEDD